MYRSSPIVSPFMRIMKIAISWGSFTEVTGYGITFGLGFSPANIPPQSKISISTEGQMGLQQTPAHPPGDKPKDSEPLNNHPTIAAKHWPGAVLLEPSTAGFQLVET